VKTLHLTDVTLRDGLQMEAVLPTPAKVGLYEALAALKYPRIEITSFSHPKWMPQFADSEALCQALKSNPAVEWMAFVPNEKGLERLLKLPIPWASAFVSVSETFNQKNVNASVEDTLHGVQGIIDKARGAGRKVRLYVSTVFGCPYEGKIDPKRLDFVLRQAADCDPDEIALSDTIGVATPTAVKEVVRQFSKIYPVDKTALHLHNTYGLALACALEGWNAGVRHFDGSTGGVGGCPYAKGATGNVSSEDLQYAFFREGLAPAPDAGALNDVFAQMKGSGIRVRSRLGEILEKGGTLYGVK